MALPRLPDGVTREAMLCAETEGASVASDASGHGGEMGATVMTTRGIRSWAVTHPGARRKQNEDAYVDRPDLGIWAVADGAGGHAAGDLASGMIADALQAISTGLSA